MISTHAAVEVRAWVLCDDVTTFSRILAQSSSLVDVTSVTDGHTHARTDRTNAKVLTAVKHIQKSPTGNTPKLSQKR